MESTGRAPALALNLSGAPRTAPRKLDNWELSVEDGDNHALRIFDEALREDSVGTPFQDIASLSRFNRTDKDIRRHSARFKLVVVQAERRPSADLPSVFVSSQLFEAPASSDANRKFAPTSARTELGKVDNAMAQRHVTSMELS